MDIAGIYNACGQCYHYKALQAGPGSRDRESDKRQLREMFDTAIRYFNDLEDSVVIDTKIHAKSGIASCKANFGVGALRLDGDYVTAERLFKESIAIQKEILVLSTDNTEAKTSCAHTKGSLAGCYIEHGKHSLKADQKVLLSNALSIATEALSDLKLVYGTDQHIEVAKIIIKIGEAKYSLHKLGESGYGGFEEDFQNAVKMVWKVGIDIHKNAIQQKLKDLHYQVTDDGVLQKINPDGAGCIEYADNSYWNIYSKAAMEELLALRIKSTLDESDVKLLLLNLYFDGSSIVASKIADEIYDGAMLHNLVIVPMNLYAKHWVGIVIESDEKCVEIHYMDPENNKMPGELLHWITEYFVTDCPSRKLSIIHESVEQQKYNNCGPEVIENFIGYLTGYRLLQEEGVAIHSILYEDSLYLAGAESMNYSVD